MTGTTVHSERHPQFELAAPERRPGERSEAGRSGGAANSGAGFSAAAPDPEVRPRARRRSFSAAYKVSMLEQADRATGPGEVGALLRREGLYSSHLTHWRQSREAGALGALSQKRGRKPSRDPWAGENEKLQRKVAQLEKKLRQAETIIDFQKKLSALLEIAVPTAPGEASE